MPRYGDDQCEECGGIRVAKSTLCAGCLVKRLDAERAENLIKRTVIEGLEGKVETYHGQLENALAYGFKQNQENVRLNRIIDELMDDVHGPEIKEG